jgi:hypothetical protein
LIRVGLVRRCGEADLLLIDQHHIISDFISQNILQGEFISILAGNSLPGQRLQYKDYSQWHNTKEQQGFIKAQEEYWLKEFEKEPPVLNLPYDYDRSWLRSFEGAALNFFLNEEETNGLIKISGDHGVTLFVTLLSVFTILLSKLSGQRDLIIGMPVTGRSHPDFQEIIGMFVNTLAIRIYPQGEKKFTDFLQDVKLKVLSGFENQDYPFNDLVEKIVTKREAWQNPLFDVVIDFHKKESISKELSRELIAAYSLNSNKKENRKKTAKFEFTLDILELKDYLYFSFEYCSELFKKETIQKFITLFKKIVDIILKKPGVKIVEIETIIREKKRKTIKNNREDNIFNENKKLDEAIAADFDW